MEQYLSFAAIGGVCIVILTIALKALRSFVEAHKARKAAEQIKAAPEAQEGPETTPDEAVVDAVNRAIDGINAGEAHSPENRTSIQIYEDGQVDVDGLDMGEVAPGDDKECDVSIVDNRPLPDSDPYRKRQMLGPDGVERPVGTRLVGKPMTAEEVKERVIGFNDYRRKLNQAADAEFKAALEEIKRDAEHMARTKMLTPERRAKIIGSKGPDQSDDEAIEEFVQLVVKHAETEARRQYSKPNVIEKLTPERVRNSNIFKWDKPPAILTDAK